MDRSLDNLCNADHFSTYELNDHWSGSYYNRPKKKIVSWNRVSASQIENYRKCPRSWFFKSIQKVGETQRGSQVLGTSYHLIMEKVPKGLTHPTKEDTNADPEEWAKAKALADLTLPLLPPDPRDLTQRECYITLETYPGGPQLIGYVDLMMPQGVGWPSFLIPASEIIIGDYKTTSDFRYMKTPEELADNVQMMTYAKWALEKYAKSDDGILDLSVEGVRLLHIYAKTRPPFTKSSIRNSSAIVTPHQIEGYWQKTLDTVREMAQVSLCGNPEDVKPEGTLNGHCEAYGGCSFRDKCGIQKESGIKGLFNISKKPKTETQETPDMSGSAIMAKIQAARAAQGLAPPQSVAAAISTPTPVAPVAPVASAKPISAMLAKLDASGKGRPVIIGSLAQAYGNEQNLAGAAFAGTGENGSHTLGTVGELVQLASGIVPPDAPSRAQEFITTPGMVVVDPLSEVEDTEESESGESPVTVAVEGLTDSAETTESIATATDTPKRRGRPSREEMAAREAAEKAAFDALVEAAVQTRLGAPVPVVSPANQVWEADRIKLQTELTALKQSNAQWELACTNLQKDKESLRTNQTQAQETPGCTLYVDCFPVKGSEPGLVDYFTWIQPIAAAVAEANKVADYRLIQYNSKALLASAIRELVKAEGLPQAMSIPAYGAGADIALEVITPLAKKIIKKVS